MKLGQKYLFAAVILLFIFTGMMFAQGNPTIKDVKAFDGYIRINWEMPDNNSEAGVNHYEVWRSSGTSVPLCVGDNIQRGVFYFDDKFIGLNKTQSQYFIYQVKAIGSKEGISQTWGIPYSPMSSTAKSTWGSIKAMFR